MGAPFPAEGDMTMAEWDAFRAADPWVAFCAAMGGEEEAAQVCRETLNGEGCPRCGGVLTFSVEPYFTNVKGALGTFPKASHVPTITCEACGGQGVVMPMRRPR